MQKLYCYIDESGQDTKGKFFVVSVVILEENRQEILQELEKIENESGKRQIKWHKVRPLFRKIYFEKIAQAVLFGGTIFFENFTSGDYYLKMTSYATAKAILKKAQKKPYTASIYVDGFNKKEVANFSKELRALQINKKNVRGVKRDENNAFIRFADALCGLIRDQEDGREWAIEMVRKLKKRGIVSAL